MAPIVSAADTPPEVARDQLALHEAISEGAPPNTAASRAESVVYRATWRDQTVAVKKYKIRTTADLGRFRKELEMLLAIIGHSNVPSILGAKRSAPDRLILMPLATSSLASEVHEVGWRPDWSEILRIAFETAAGIGHLHTSGIIHCDVKPANVLLLGTHRNAIITDFGISQYHKVSGLVLKGGGMPTGGFHKKRMVGTLQYMAPEVLLKEPPSYASDAYAWAVTINELATGTIPFSDCTKDNPACHTVLDMGYGQAELAAAVVAEGLRPLMRPDTPEALKQILESCWMLNPEHRPGMDAVLKALAAAQESMPDCAASAPSSMAQTASTHLMDLDSSEGAIRSRDGKPWGVPGWKHLLHCDGWNASCLSAGAYETAGLRGQDKMEDRHLVISHAGDSEDGPMLLGVFDGHRGAEAAVHASDCLEEELGKAWANSASPANALKSAFVSLDRGFVTSQQAEWEERVQRMGAAAGDRVKWPGCTALATLIMGGRLYVANTGDCRGVLCRDGRAIQVSRDHCTADDKERQRVSEAGGKISWRIDSWRIGDAAIQVTRSIGDYDLRGQGLTPEPEVTEFDIGPNDEFLVMASDGVFDVLNNEEVIGLVHDTVKDPSMCGQRIATEALTRGSGDNITVVVAFLQPVTTLESIYSNGQQKYNITATLYGSRQEMLHKYAHARAADEMRDMCY